MENWKEVDYFFNNYEVSDLGRVRNKETGQLLKPLDNGVGYKIVELCKKGFHKRFYVHRLVADVFLDNPDRLPEVNHKNAIRDDNRALNLEWVSKQENLRKRVWSKPILMIKDDKVIKEFDHAVEAAEYVLTLGEYTKKYPIQVAICQTCKGQRKQAYGYV